jgi:hypothetical protein
MSVSRQFSLLGFWVPGFSNLVMQMTEFEEIVHLRWTFAAALTV